VDDLLYCLEYADDLTIVVRGKFTSTLLERSQMALRTGILA